jgi:putative transposase
MTETRKSKCIAQQIIGFIKQAETGVALGDLCRKHGLGNASFYTWRSKYGGISVPEAWRLEELEGENAKLKRLLAEAHSVIRGLKTVFGGKQSPHKTSA